MFPPLFGFERKTIDEQVCFKVGLYYVALVYVYLNNVVSWHICFLKTHDKLYIAEIIFQATDSEL